MSDSIIIATRESPLALWQAEHVQALLRERYPEKDVKLLGMTTKGDQILDKTLSKIGGKGLFVKELEVAMQEGSAHLAVHSLKDVPMELPEGFVLAAVSSREDPRDAFVSPRYETLESMPAGSVVGTASLRRELMLRSKFPHLVVKPVRGNVGTRLRKLDSGEYDALIMASAGLKRLGLEERMHWGLNVWPMMRKRVRPLPLSMMSKHAPVAWLNAPSAVLSEAPARCPWRPMRLLPIQPCDFAP